ncbi:MAG: pyruvate formate lyase-activating protein [Desulfobacca sp. 4484_104]|nr:MAG: pyruvate formate lyase-activating protein [Desulfobacca sp. 4484_104]
MPVRTAWCRYCGQESPFISRTLGFCASCIRQHFDEVWPEIDRLHQASRQAFRLPVRPPRDPTGKLCTLCFQACRIPEGEVGYCGARRVEAGQLRGGGPAGARLSFYHDPLPTNCVADWFCPGGTGRGYPHYAHRPGPEHGYLNLAVFYHACNFNCLYCQNWHFKKCTFTSPAVSARQLAAAVQANTACLCYFGGDPTPQLPNALATARLIRHQPLASGRPVRICWETNGAMQARWLKPLVASCLDNGGIIKIDLKAFSEEIHLALCGVSTSQTLKNFAALAARARERPEVPLLMASTLMVPGYVDLAEIHGLARFIATLNPDIPYSLLAFYPQFYLNDLPVTSRDFALQAQQVALAAGVRNVHLGNIHLLH